MNMPKDERLEERNARITAVTLEIEDHGILTCHITTEFRGGCQSFGGYALDAYDADKKKRVGSAWGMEFIRRVLETVGVDSLDGLKGKTIRTRGNWSKISAIGHIIDDKWFDPGEDLKDLRD